MKPEVFVLLFLMAIANFDSKVAGHFVNYSSVFSEESKFSGLDLLDTKFLSSFMKQNLSDACRKDTTSFLTSLNNFDLWALKLFDASAKLPSGVLNGNINQFGDFDQCLSVQSKNGKFKGKHCLVTVQLTLSDKEEHLSDLRRLLLSTEPYTSEFEDDLNFIPKSSESYWGLCVPSSCTNEDVSLALREQLIQATRIPEVNWQIEVKKGMCQVKVENWVENLDSKVIIATMFFALIVVVSIFATLYDHIKAGEVKNQWLTAFSIIKNFNQITSISTSNSEIRSLHGIRMINTILLVLSHKSMVLNFYPIVNRTSMNKFFVVPISIMFRSCYLYTDVFFMLSGLLVTHSYFARMQRGQKVNIFKEILGRYFRFMPPIAALVCFATFVFPVLGDGPQWPSMAIQKSELCKQNGLFNFLMIQNMLGFDKICMANTHHVATDFILFTASIFLVVFMFHHPKKGFFGVVALAIASTVARFYVVYARELVIYITHGAKVSKMHESADFMYIIPPYRFSVYAIGILLGFILHKFQNSQLTQKQLKLGWLAAVTSLVMTVIICLVNMAYTPLNDAIFAGIGSMSFCFFFSWIIFAAHLGHKNNLIRALEWRYLKIGTNLAYSIYLVQFLVFHFNVGTARSSFFYTAEKMLDVNEMVTIFFAASAMSIFIEYPFINIKKLLFDGPFVPPTQSRHRSPSVSKKSRSPASANLILSRTAKKHK